MAFLKRIAQSGFYSARYFKSPAASFNLFGYRELSQLEKPDLVDETEKLRSDIEKMGSELRHGIDKVRTGKPLVIELAQKAKLLEVKTAVWNFQVQTEKLKAEVVKLHDELKCEMMKVTIACQLELSNEVYQILEKQANENRENWKLSNKLMGDFQAVKTQVETTKFDMARYIIGTFILICGVCIALIPISPKE